MKTLLIIGCVLLYIMLGTIVSLIARNALYDEMDLFFATMFWPLFTAFGIIWLIFVVIPKWIIDHFD